MFTSYADEKPELKPAMRVLMFAREECPDTGRMHWQGAVCFKHGKTLKAAKRCVGGNPHMQTMKGTWKHQVAYIKGPFEDGDKKKPENDSYECLPDEDAIPSQGKRTDIKELIDEIMDGKEPDEVLVENPMAYHQYGRTMLRAKALRDNRVKRDFMTQGIWYWGPTGCGKTRKAHDEYGESLYVVPRDGGWWDMYEGQEAVLFDDFRGHVEYDELLRLVDRYEYTVKRRYVGPRQFISKVVLVTSALPPEEVYHRRNERDSIEQLLRRFTVIQMHS